MVSSDGLSSDSIGVARLGYMLVYLLAIEDMDASKCTEILAAFVEDKVEVYDSDNARYTCKATDSTMSITAVLHDRSSQIVPETDKPVELASDPATVYSGLSKGSKGDTVKELQQRLIDLKYLTGTADGDYGNKTALAVTTFQKVAGIEPSGIADSNTQAELYDSSAKENPEPPFDPSIYTKMNYKAVARDPNAYDGNMISFSGKVIQVLEGAKQTHYRIATRGSSNDIVIVFYTRPDGASRILEDDRVTVYGHCTGVHSYESTLGSTITIPSCNATRIELN